MKKLLLLAGVAAMSFAAVAEEIDITPSNYHFNTANTLPLLSKGVHGANIQGVDLGNGKMTACAAPIWETLEAIGAGNDKEYNNGLLIIGGGQFWNHSNGYYPQAASGTKLVDLGGQVGQVLAFVGNKCNIKEVYAEKTGYTYDFPQAVEGGSNWGNLNFFLDPKNCPSKSKGYLKFKITYQTYVNDYTEDGQALTNIYVKTNQNGYQEYKAGGTPYWEMFEENDDEEWEHQTNRWKVLEFAYALSDDEEGKTYGPARLTLNFGGGFFPGTGALLIKDITVLLDDSDTAYENKVIAATNFDEEDITLEMGEPTSAAVKTIGTADDAVEYFNLQGIRVAEPANGIYIRRQGDKASKVVVK